MTTWHLTDADLTGYADGSLAAPFVWSVEAHLAACEPCRARLTAAAPAALLDEGWQRLDAALDAPVPGPVERALVAVGVSEPTARLLAATPALRLSWVSAVAVTVALTALMAYVADPVVFLVLTPLLPLLGVAAAFGPRTDPTYELTVVAPIHTFRLVLLRCVAVLSVVTVLAAVATLVMATEGPPVVGWFLPSLGLTSAALLLAPRLGPVTASSVVGAGWLVLVVATGLSTDTVLFSLAGQAVIAVGAAAAALGLRSRAHASDTAGLSPRHLRRSDR
ncbi:zf-HC2 domain-containing protein [Virgisporangium ochraceum]|uniref:Zf-HC2 domain-containing protein n=1 Tax=Virgisporangium ochraceum TaxID=65505 RepID=A0A8J3ZQE8_9ACTN|nr:zf-HC2 domain-containing protein [Virgisporangium ochraceum]GIJ67147.1 hypothetical protein Voc01_020640 [Virgisporangium ochraceum]